jgi:ABC-type nitrate/sulfonate/bicarbonate transport system ATPase subunit
MRTVAVAPMRTSLSHLACCIMALWLVGKSTLFRMIMGQEKPEKVGACTGGCVRVHQDMGASAQLALL